MKLPFKTDTATLRQFFACFLLALAFPGSLRAQAADHHDASENTAPEDAHGTDAHSGHAEAIVLAPEDMRDFGIHMATAGPGTVTTELRLPGEIYVNENATAHISPRFDSVAIAIHRHLGEQVRAGEVLAEMESNDTLRPFELTTPIDGTVVQIHLTMGESLEAGEYAFIVADTSTVWADLRVYQRDLPQIVSGLKVRISAGTAFPDVTGRVSYLGPVVDETTRTGLARVVLENPDGIYLPGLFIVGTVVIEEIEFPVVVPLSAVHTLDGESSVYVASADGKGYEPRAVAMGHKDANSVEVRAGLEAGERYVAEGGFFLKADSQKEKFGEGHNH